MSLINRAAARKYIMEYAARNHRAGQITQISPEVYYAMEVAAKKAAWAIVDRHPSAFKTLKL